MRKEIIICDKCKKEKECKQIFIKTGRKSDATGLMGIDVGYSKDICFDCLISVVYSLEVVHLQELLPR